MELAELPLLADSVISELFNVVGFDTNGTDTILELDSRVELGDLDFPPSVSSRQLIYIDMVYSVSVGVWSVLRFE